MRGPAERPSGRGVCQWDWWSCEISDDRRQARTLKANLFANFIGQGVYSSMAILFVPIYVGLLGIESYGLIGFYTLLQITSGILEMAVVPSVAREMARFTSGGRSIDSMRDLLKSVFVITSAAGLMLILAVASLAHWFAASWLQTTELSPDVVANCIMLMGCVIGIRINESVFRSVLTGLQFQVIYNVAFALLAILRYAGVIVFLGLVGDSIELFFVWQVAISVFGILTYGILAYWRIPKGSRKALFSFSSLASIKAFTAGVFFVGLLSTLISQLDKIFLSAMIPLDQFGYYSLAATAAATLVLLVSPFSQAFFPRLVELFTQNDQEKLAAVYLNASRMAGIVICSFGVPLIVFSESVILVWSGDAVLAARSGPFLQVLAAAAMLGSLLGIPLAMQFASGWTSLAIALWLTCLAPFVLALSILIPTYGAISGSWAWLGLNIVLFLASIEFMHRRILKGQKHKWYLSAVLAPLVGSAIPCGMLYMIGLSGDRWFDLMTLAFEGAVGLSLAVLLTWKSGRFMDSAEAGAPPSI
jgi:O-antigen/teichoic acid export membrane protein